MLLEETFCALFVVGDLDRMLDSECGRGRLNIRCIRGLETQAIDGYQATVVVVKRCFCGGSDNMTYLVLRRTKETGLLLGSFTSLVENSENLKGQAHMRDMFAPQGSRQVRQTFILLGREEWKSLDEMGEIWAVVDNREERTFL